MIVCTGPQAGWYYYHYDGCGNCIALSNANRQIVEAYSYDHFGQPVIVTSAGTDGNWLTPADGTTATASQFGNRFMFTGREYESETGLYYYRARMYNPDLGRFMQTDPIGYAGGLNMYTYCGNNATNWADPYGLCKKGFVDYLQNGLDVIGIVDPFGVADGLNCLIYLGRGQYGNAGISLAGMIPYIGDLAKGVKYGGKAFKAAEVAADVARVERKVANGVEAAARTSKALTEDQAALRTIVNEATNYGRKKLSVADTETVIDWAKQSNYPGFRASASDLADPSHWVKGPHIHMENVGRSGHVPVSS